MKTRSTLACLILSLFVFSPLFAEEMMAPPMPDDIGLPGLDVPGDIDLDTPPYPFDEGMDIAPLGETASGQGSTFDGNTPQNAVYDASYDQHYYIEATMLFKQKQYEDAIELFSKIGAPSSYYVSAMTFKGLVSSRLGNFGQAYATYQAGLKADPSNADLTKRVARMRKLMEQAELFNSRGPSKKITTYVRKTKKSKRLRTSAAEFGKGGYKIKETRYKKGKKHEVSTYAYNNNGTVKKEMVANRKGNLKRSTTWSRSPHDAAGKAQGHSWTAVDFDKNGKETEKRIWTDYDQQGRPQKLFVLDGEGSEFKREEYAYDAAKVLIEVYESGSLSQRQEETRDQFGNAIKAVRNFAEVEFLLEYDEFGNWTRKESRPRQKDQAVIERDFVFFGR